MMVRLRDVKPETGRCTVRATVNGVSLSPYRSPWSVRFLLLIMFYIFCRIGDKCSWFDEVKWFVWSCIIVFVLFLI